MRQSGAMVKSPDKDVNADQKALHLAVALARLLDLKKGDHVEILDLRGITILADCFVFATGFARVQIQALAEAALEEARKAGCRCRSVEGYEDSGWILLDFGDVIVHLMTEESRDYYRLDRLWGDAPRISWMQGADPSSGPVETGKEVETKNNEESRAQSCGPSSLAGA